MAFATGTYIKITASADTFEDTDVGQQLWVRYSTRGAGSGGRATITDIQSATVAIAYVISDIDETALAAGGWEFATKEVVNLHLFEGLEVNIQADGGGHPALTVTDGTIELQNWASRIFVGFGYQGRLVTQNLDVGGITGPANSKPRNIKRIRARFFDTIGARVGPDEYICPEVVFNKADANGDRVPPPFTGVRDVQQLDKWDADRKQGVVLHNQPVPCTVLGLDIVVQTSEPP
jgi:hypothetical protein